MLAPDNLTRYGAHWLAPDPTVADVVDQYWYVSWNLGDQSVDQRIIDAPAVTLTVEDGDGRLLLDNGLTDENGNPDQVSLNPYPAGAIPPANAYTLMYNSPNVTNAATAKNNVTYKHLQLTGADAANYCLADSAKEALAGNDTAGYTMPAVRRLPPMWRQATSR